jgi:hypothetical protein
MDNLQSILLSEKPDDQAYTFFLSPGVVRYLKFADFLKADVEHVISELEQSSANLEIKSPVFFMEELSEKEWDYFHEFQKIPPSKPSLGFYQIDDLIGDESWETKLRVHHVFGYFFTQKKLSSDIYWLFHLRLNLEKHFAIDECAASWVAGTVDNADLAKSYKVSKEHLVVFSKHRNEDGEYYVFKITDFVKGRLEAVAQLENERTSFEEAERLRKSQFSTFVYIMQDMRNDAFKIGQSITPGKRERTLQSEVPEIVLRFSIPADESLERQLHEHFESKNIRGEWFALEPDELLWVISFLKTNGDASRATVDYEWFGKISFQESVKYEDKA